jgi:hypothetical protein
MPHSSPPELDPFGGVATDMAPKHLCRNPGDLTVSAGDVMAVLEKLPIGAAAGASGWTDAVMKALFLRNGDYKDRASLLLATFCNLMLSGQLRSQVWIRTRLLGMVPLRWACRPLQGWRSIGLRSFSCAIRHWC